MRKTLFITLLTWLIPLQALAQAKTPSAYETAQKLLKESAEKAGLQEGVTTEPTALVSGIINAGVSILGVIAVLLVIYAGAMWLTASGNEEQVKKAIKILRSTVIGIIIVGLAYGITAFILSLVLA